MPGKHVRFATEKTIYPAPALLQRAHTISSSNTPSPPVQYVALPAHTPHPPRRSHTTDSHSPSTRAHKLLAFADSDPILNFDLTRSPSAITTHHHHVSTSGFSDSAVSPPQASLTIVTPHLPWSISVAASSNGHYVTVADVLQALYRSLRTNVTAPEFHALKQQKLMRRVSEAYTERYMRLHGHRGYEEEKKSGVKRVDFLMGNTKFRGLSAAGPADVWRLHVV
ncbi:hypothetical protein R3P38DRAFT_2910969 [Favolaschia claudopus]|uniref:DUF6699 domain-containing protein n=1 Tax=Favolaschia claudopus TaxID=2862362 RepID=A0AAW0CB77_9AGAR